MLFNRFYQPDFDLESHTAEDVVKSMMAGPKVAMMTSALLRRGIDYLQEVEAKLVKWMADHEYASIREMQGSMSRRAVTDPEALERANYLHVLRSYTLTANRR